MLRASLALVVVSAACGGEPVSAAFFGAAPAPPGKLAVLRAGMSFDDARSVLPANAVLDRNGVATVPVASGHAKIAAAVEFDAGKIAAVDLTVPGAGCEATLTRAWGAPQAGTTLDGHAERFWTNDRDHWKAVLTTDGGCQVRIAPYQAMTAEFFGTEVAPPAALAKVTIGMSVDDAAEVAPELMAQDAHAEDVKLLRASAPVAAAGVPSDVHAFADDGGHGRIEHVGLEMKPQSLSMLKQAWGEPTKTADGELMWTDKATGWRARAQVDAGDKVTLKFDRSSD